MMNKGLLFVMSGPSGTGKGTICDELLKHDNNLFLSVSATTRECRKNEIEGVTYYYKTADEFKRMINNGEMLEHAVYNGNYYGTPREKVEEKLEAGINVLLEIEPQGALAVKENFPEAILIFIIPPSAQVLKQRLIDRGREDELQIEKRLNTAKWELEQACKYSRICVNDNLDECVREVEDIIKEEYLKRNKVNELLKEWN